MASPRLRAGLALSELQRQVAEDRRAQQRQLEALERRLQEHLTAPAANRERWADLQGSVSGLLEEVANLVRRVEGLDEKLRIRTASCEELLRQRSRELEQQLHGQQQKVHLAVSTFEEMSKRQTSKLRKLVSSSEEHSRKLVALEDMTRRAQMGPTSPLEAFQARLSELEGQQASLEEEFRGVVTASTVAQAISPRHAPREEDVGARLLESELAKLSKQLATQLDEHSAALANLRVRTESQEQRLSAAGDRLEKLVAPTLEALRGEMHQLRAAERAETEQQLEHLARQLKDLSETNEEAIAELKEAAPGNHVISLQEMQQMRETCALQEDQLQRLMAYLDQQGLPREEMDLPDVVFRVERLENRMESFNQDAMSEKADRSELHRLDLALEELQQPLRRLSQRTASNEARTTALEHRLEQFQDKLPNVIVNSTDQTTSNEQADATGLRLGEISARVMELEELLPQISSRAAAHQGHERKEFLERLEKLEAAAGAPRPSASVEPLSNEVRAQMDEVSDMASKALKIAENSGNNMQALRFDLMVEQERVAKLGKELQSLSNSFRDEQSKIQHTAERQEDHEQRANEAMQKLVASMEKVQGLQHGYEGGTSALNKLVESIAQRVEAAEAALAASEVHMLRDAIKADLLELQEERFKTFQQSVAKGGSDGTGPKEDATLVPRVEEMAQHLEDLEKQLLEKVEELDKKLSAKMVKIGSSTEELRRDLDDALQRVEASEEASKAVREELMAEDQNEAYTLARTCQNDLRGVHSDVADLQASLRKLASRMEGPPGVRPETPKTLENRVHELQKQVTEELDQLTKHQQLISKVGLKGKVDTQDLEKSVNALAAQVSQELTELRAHQTELSKVQQMVRSKASKDGSDVELKVEELKLQVVSEVDALAQQQAELGKAKVTISELSERVQEAVHTANECKQGRPLAPWRSA